MSRMTEVAAKEEGEWKGGGERREKKREVRA